MLFSLSRGTLQEAPKYGTPNFRKLPYEPQTGTTMGPVGKDEMNAEGVYPDLPKSIN